MIEREHPRRPSWARALVAGLAAAAALALVAASSRAGSAGPHRPPGWQSVSSAVSSASTVVLVTLIPIAAVGGILLVFAMQLLSRRRRDELEAAGLLVRPNRLVQLAVVATLVGLAVLIHRGDLHLPALSLARFRDLAGSGHPRKAAVQPRAAAGTGVSDDQWIAAVGCWLAIAAATVWWLRRRSSRAGSGEQPEQLEMEPELVVSTLEDVRAEPDPRRAVIGAYALMEQLLGERGSGRSRAEAPLEYLRRIEREQAPAAPPARTLTRLFLRARFAAGSVGPAAKAEALAALESLQAAPS